jgi:HTH-type transcriptional regulator/antitoxin HigA
MQITAIRTEEDYRAAMQAIEVLLPRVDELSEEEDRKLEALSILVADYEERHFPIGDLSPIDYLREHMLQFGRKQSDLAALLGSSSLASEIMNRHRALSLEAIRKISAEWNIPASILIEPYEIERRKA